MPDRPRRLTARSISLTLASLGLVGMIASGAMLFDVWYARRVWLGSAEHQRIEQVLERDLSETAAPASDAGRSLAEDDPGLTAGDAARVGVSALDTGTASRLAVPVRQVEGVPPQQVRTMPTVVVPDALPPQQRASAETGTVEVVESHVRLLALPQPGAPAVLSVTVRNRSDAPSPPIVIGIAADWFEHYSIIGAIPPVVDDRASYDGYRSFEFPGASPGADVTLELHVSTVGESARTPTVRVSLREGAPLGDLRPELIAEEFSLGPVRALSVPRLGIRTGVVDTPWEPPPFVAGQISTTANLGEGNSVLIGHRGGRAGDVFVRLIGARLGDEVVGASHGVERRYVVSEILMLPNHDSTPIRPTETPRLTLMTCVGVWNPLTGDYSHRLWVIAEPLDVARSTLAAAVERASHTAATSTDPSHAVRARTDAALARAALNRLDAKAHGRR